MDKNEFVKALRAAAEEIRKPEKIDMVAKDMCKMFRYTTAHARLSLAITRLVSPSAIKDLGEVVAAVRENSAAFGLVPRKYCKSPEAIRRDSSALAMGLEGSQFALWIYTTLAAKLALDESQSRRLAEWTSITSSKGLNILAELLARTEEWETDQLFREVISTGKRFDLSPYCDRLQEAQAFEEILHKVNRLSDLLAEYKGVKCQVELPAHFKTMVEGHAIKKKVDSGDLVIIYLPAPKHSEEG